jgi:hypothetical protein
MSLSLPPEIWKIILSYVRSELLKLGRNSRQPFSDFMTVCREWKVSRDRFGVFAPYITLQIAGY